MNKSSKIVKYKSKIPFLKPFFVPKKSLIFHGIFLPKKLLAVVFKNPDIREYFSMLKTKKKLNGPFLLTKLENPKERNFYS